MIANISAKYENPTMHRQGEQKCPTYQDENWAILPHLQNQHEFKLLFCDPMKKEISKESCKNLFLIHIGVGGQYMITHWYSRQI